MLMFNLEMENFILLKAIPAPPPRLAPGRGVEIYEMPPISNISSILLWCFLLSLFSHTSLKKQISAERSFMSSEKLINFAQILLILYDKTTGKLSAWTHLFSRLITFRTVSLSAYTLGGR